MTRAARFQDSSFGFRLLTGGGLGWCVGLAILASETPLVADVCVLVVIALTLWRPAAGFVATLALAPGGLLIARPPVHAAELLACAFLASWLLAVWRPLTAGPLPRALLAPAFLYGAWVVASWLSLTIGGAAGIEQRLLPAFLLQSLTVDYLVASTPEPETWTMLQTTMGVALFVASITVARSDRALRRLVAYALVVSMAALAAATVGDVVRGMSAQGFAYVLRFVQGTRFSLHLEDLNAAGSLYVLAALVAVAFATGEPRVRWLWVAAVAAMVPALWLAGSRTATLAAIATGAVVIPLARRQISVRLSRTAAMVASAAVIVIAAGLIAAARQPAERGSAALSARLRLQFLQTSARMFATSPVVGVGVGRYHELSGEFMPADLRAIYPNENAHNYFAQQFAELGIVGGALFVWLAVAGGRAAWRAARAHPGDAAAVGLCAGTIGYLLTCVTGHPLLVPEAALPFFGAFGAIASAAPDADAYPQRAIRAAGAVVLVLAVSSVGWQGAAFVRVAEQPGDRGFYDVETGEDGTRFRWMTRHGVTYIPPQPGLLTVPVHAPRLPRARAFAMDVYVGGQRVETYGVPSGRWITLVVPVRQPASGAFRRIDLRTNHEWTRTRDLGHRSDRRPLSLMVGEMSFEPVSKR